MTMSDCKLQKYNIHFKTTLHYLLLLKFLKFSWSASSQFPLKIALHTLLATKMQILYWKLLLLHRWNIWIVETKQIHILECKLSWSTAENKHNTSCNKASFQSALVDAKTHNWEFKTLETTYCCRRLCAVKLFVTFGIRVVWCIFSCVLNKNIKLDKNKTTS